MTSVSAHRVSNGYRLLREKRRAHDELLGLMEIPRAAWSQWYADYLISRNFRPTNSELGSKMWLASEVIRHRWSAHHQANAKTHHAAGSMSAGRNDAARGSPPALPSFQQLLSNAVKFTSNGGAVDITVEPAAEASQVDIRDTGLGIPKNELPHIFDKYQQTTTESDRW